MIDESLAPIVLFVYNRPEHTLMTLNALKNNYLAGTSKLFIYADGAKIKESQESRSLIDRVQEIIRRERWCGEVEYRISKNNLGCRKTIEAGVTDIVNEYGSIIVIEDDIVTSPYFLTYMNDGLKKYESKKEVMLIGGYTPPVNLKMDQDIFFLKYASPWGWATWSDSWSKNNMADKELLSKLKSNKLNHHFDFNGSQGFVNMIEEGIEGNMEPWDVCWYATVYLNDGLGIYPKKSLVRNIGFDGSGIHCGTGYWYDIKRLYSKKVKFEDEEIREDQRIRDLYVEFYFGTNKIGLKEKIKFKYELEKRKIKKLLTKNIK